MSSRVRLQAFQDISEEIRKSDLKLIDENDDVWIVTPSRMDNKETRRMNKELGINRLNYLGNNNGRKTHD